jgi:hypothetical protein
MQQESRADHDRSTERVAMESGFTKDLNLERRLDLAGYVRAKDVQQALGCSLSHAYEHLRRATGKTGRCLLRAPVEVWEAYARLTFGAHATAAGWNGGDANETTDDWLHDIENQLDRAYQVLGALRSTVAHHRARVHRERANSKSDVDRLSEHVDA